MAEVYTAKARFLMEAQQRLVCVEVEGSLDYVQKAIDNLEFDPAKIVTIHSNRVGRVEELKVKVGQKIKPGQELLDISQLDGIWPVVFPGDCPARVEAVMVEEGKAIQHGTKLFRLRLLKTHKP